MTAPRITRWQPITNPGKSMLGFFSIELASGLVLNDLRLMRGPAGKLWVAMPSVQLFDRDGNPRIDLRGKQVWKSFVDFDSPRTRSRFEALTLGALHDAHPEVFKEGEGP